MSQPYPLPETLQPRRWTVSADAVAAPGRPPERLLDRHVHTPAPHPSGPAAPALLLPHQPMADEWWAAAPVERGETHEGPARLRWACDGDWLHARITVDETALADGLIGAARLAYARLFELMARHRMTEPARFWNYLADINRETGSPEFDGGRLERYRQFNIGRQQAFAAAGQAAFDGAPAACALGTGAGALSVALLASRIAPRAIENPRQVSAYRYPGDYGPVSPTFSRAAELRLPGGPRLLFISGTASIVGHASLHAGDVAEQTRESLRNIDVLLGQIETDDTHALRTRLDLTVYLRDGRDLSSVRPIIADWLQHDAATLDRTVWLRADVCRAELLVEIEAQALLPAPTEVRLPGVPA